MTVVSVRNTLDFCALYRTLFEWFCRAYLKITEKIHR